MKYAPFLLLAVYLWTGCTMPPPAAPAKPPNIILILADDMGYSDLGAMGSEIATPHLDRLAGDGLLFTQAYNAGRCCPTRASLLTGQYQHATGVGFMTGDLGNPHYQGYLNRQCATLAELLQPAGYATMMSGKWHLGDQPGQRPQQRGFDQFFGVPEGGGVYFMPFRKNRTVVLGDTPIEVDTAHFYTTIAFNDYACRFIAEHTDTSEAPFFLYLPHIAPHFPLQVPDSSLARYLGTYREGFAKLRARRFARQQRLGLLPPHLQLSPPDELVEDWEALSEEEQVCYDRKMAAYAAQITLMDQGIGRLVDLLEARGELDNTLILFLSDNGGTSEQLQQPENCESIGGRTSWTSLSPSWANVSNTPYRLYKRFVHQGGILTPLIAHFPAGQTQAAQIGQPVHIIDIVPTCLSLAGAEYPDSLPPLPGRDLSPYFQGKAVAEPEFLAWEHMGNRALRQGQYKLVARYQQAWELYDMDLDPTELHDLAAERPEEVARLATVYDRWAEAQGVVPWESISPYERF